jgi:predicted O-methyltransferase YrrM
VEIDTTGESPTLVARRADGRAVQLNGRRPADEADRWLGAVLGDRDPAVIVVIGLGLGHVLDALERRDSRASVVAFEPFPEALPHFHARRGWSAWLDTGRLQIVTAPTFAGGKEMWTALAPIELPPVLVMPALAAGFSATVAACRVAFMRSLIGTTLDPHLTVNKQSMLHPIVLTTVEHLASSVTGVIVEVGAYVGGATIAMARGVRDAGRKTRIVTIEGGGEYLTHPDLPSADIFGDLQRNLQSRGLDRLVTLYRGMSDDQAALDLVRETLIANDARIGMLCIDADGKVQRDFDLYLPWCADGCVLVVDDYAATGLHNKALPTQEAVQRLIANGRAQELGVYGYGTWMGIYHP